MRKKRNFASEEVSMGMYKMISQTETQQALKYLSIYIRFKNQLHTTNNPPQKNPKSFH